MSGPVVILFLVASAMLCAGLVGGRPAEVHVEQNASDRGYAYEKTYAYSRETASFDFLADKPVLDAREIVEKYGGSDDSLPVDGLGIHGYA